MNDAAHYRKAAKRSRLTDLIAKTMKLSNEQQVLAAQNKNNPLLYRLAALRCLVWNSSVGLGQCYAPKRRLVRQALAI